MLLTNVILSCTSSRVWRRLFDAPPAFMPQIRLLWQQHGKKMPRFSRRTKESSRINMFEVFGDLELVSRMTRLARIGAQWWRGRA
jgi:hypothetical protein